MNRSVLLLNLLHQAAKMERMDDDKVDITPFVAAWVAGVIFFLTLYIL